MAHETNDNTSEETKEKRRRRKRKQTYNIRSFYSVEDDIGLDVGLDPSDVGLGNGRELEVGGVGTVGGLRRPTANQTDWIDIEFEPHLEKVPIGNTQQTKLYIGPGFKKRFHNRLNSASKNGLSISNYERSKSFVIPAGPIRKAAPVKIFNKPTHSVSRTLSDGNNGFRRYNLGRNSLETLSRPGSQPTNPLPLPLGFFGKRGRRGHGYRSHVDNLMFPLRMKVKPRMSLRGVLPTLPTKKDLASQLHLSAEDLNPDAVKIRKKYIELEMLREDCPEFTKKEEYDIYTRAEAYAKSVLADPDYYIVSSTPVDKTDQADQRTNSNQNVVQHREKSRKPRLPVICSNKAYPPESLTSIFLPNGTQLIKPPAKLVELVAQTINDSPDKLLQVQQVYNVLRSKFPYYQYLDKVSLTSWRSSIRHALFQKWFRKIQFQTDLIHTKGCYWAINRKSRPREWHLPLQKQEAGLNDTLCESTILSLPESVADETLAESGFTSDNNTTESKDGRSIGEVLLEELESDTVHQDPETSRADSGYASSNASPMPRDSDPMLNTQNHFMNDSQNPTSLNNLLPDDVYEATTEAHFTMESPAEQLPESPVNYIPWVSALYSPSNDTLPYCLSTETVCQDTLQYCLSTETVCQDTVPCDYNPHISADELCNSPFSYDPWRSSLDDPDSSPFASPMDNSSSDLSSPYSPL